jgi:glycosyltransferase involved in cell wall biosynthesis
VEHIVQDAGSDDGTLDWLCWDPRIRVYVEKDQGMYDAINRGLEKATGEIIAHLNCDEQYLPGALAAVERFLRDHPGVELIFADAVVVDPQGGYLFHRKVQRPLLYHTWTCPLSTLTCATFFRRGLIAKRKLFFDPRWRCCGDSAWVLRMLQERVPMAVLRQFTSVFQQTGKNLSLEPEAQKEADIFFASAPAVARRLRLLILLFHRLRRLTAGIYSQEPFTYSIYTQQSLSKRVSHYVGRPTGRWTW